MSLREYININAIPFGAVLVGAVSGLIALIFANPESPRMRSWIIWGVPFALAITLNALPIWDRGSYPSCGWSVIIIFMWAIFGGVLSLIITNYKQHLAKHKKK